MKVAILAGGSESRLQEEMPIRPKPRVEIGGRVGRLRTHLMTVPTVDNYYHEILVRMGVTGLTDGCSRRSGSSSSAASWVDDPLRARSRTT